MEFFLHDDKFLHGYSGILKEPVNLLTEDRPCVDVRDYLGLTTRKKLLENLWGQGTYPSAHLKHLGVCRHLQRFSNSLFGIHLILF